MIERLLAKGYLPKELPPTFQTAAFAAHVTAASPLTLHAAPGQRFLISRPGVHNLGRPGQVRRKLQLWNPFNYYELAALLEGGWADIERHFDQSPLSISRPVCDPMDRRAFVTDSDGNDLPEHRARIRTGARFVLRTDIARFYHTIYTHSIPWALHGKPWAKATRTGGLGNELDRALRNGQDGQTLGIPIGPDASLILAEIIASAVDVELAGTSAAGYRFIDDFEMAFQSRSAAEHGLAKVEERLADFELAINPLKTAIDQLPQELQPPWRAEISTYEFKDYDRVSRRELLRYFNRVFALHVKFPSESVIAYAIGRLRAIAVEDKDWDLFQYLLLQCAVAEPASLPTILGQLSRHAAFGISRDLTKALNDVVMTHAPLAHGSEVSWALWSAIWFGLPLDSGVDPVLATMDDPVVALLALHARERGLISLPQSAAAWAARTTKAELYDRGWLLAYEAVRRGWLPAKEEEAMRSDLNYGPLFAAELAFYETEPGTPVTYLYDISGYGDFLVAEPPTDAQGDFDVEF